jgi:YggT family protein
MNNPFAELIEVLVGLYITIILVRFFLQYFRADFYNPLSQFVIKATNLFILPLRKIIPGFGGIDISSLVLAYLIILIKVILIQVINGQFNFNILFFTIYSLFDLTQSILRLFILLIFVRVILSWISPGGYNPVAMVLGQISEPIIFKFRKLLPPMSGFDFAPLLALILIFFIQNSLSYYILPLIKQIT